VAFENPCDTSVKKTGLGKYHRQYQISAETQEADQISMFKGQNSINADNLNNV
jgi:hypothetical protein